MTVTEFAVYLGLASNALTLAVGVGVFKQQMRQVAQGLEELKTGLKAAVDDIGGFRERLAVVEYVVREERRKDD